MLTPLLMLIETVSYIIRVFSLGIGLEANIIAGHSLLVIVSSFVSVILFHFLD
jgi:F-type H+-transporting ATPase subunit a